ncbi:prolyl oligopeptidase family serine peptidase [Marinobacter hydrocarbonoclasticus]|nr:prolyl oligopeptidase family serine peptidase [Marinobacter nauticus]
MLSKSKWSSLLVAALLAGCQSGLPQMPDSPKGPVVDQLHGQAVADPYRYLEDPQQPQTQTWVEAQRLYGEAVLSAIPNRDVVENRISELWNYEKVGAPWFKGEREFFFRNDGLQSQSVMYVIDQPGAEPRVLLDPNTLSEAGTVALSGISVSPDGTILGYGVSQSGSDWQQWHFVRIDDGKSLGEPLEWIKFSTPQWDKAGTGVWYARYDAPKGEGKLEEVNHFQKLYYHKIGNAQSDDTLVYERPDQPEWGFSPTLTDDGKGLVISVWQGTDRRNRVFLKTLATGKVTPLMAELKAEMSFLGNDGSRFYFKTDLDAPNGRIIAMDVANPAPANWQTLVAETASPIDSVKLVNDHFVVVRLKDVLADVAVYELNGQPSAQLDLPGAGRVVGLSGRRTDESLYFSFNSTIHPAGVYRYDFKGAEVDAHRLPEVAFNPDDYVSEQVFYRSKDGTQVPMLITYKKGLKKDGNNPTLLYAYGGFNISVTPRFSPATIAWLDMGGVYAVPNLRGGGEYGLHWHQGGMLGNKQNVFDDYFAAAEYLVDQGYTRSERLGAYGRSNGGLLMGAALTQRPDLFAAVLPAVGVLDMLRYHKFTIGWAWVPEYGSADNAADFEFLKAYSPYHNVTEQAYPATMVMTADHDDRVVPAHSYKFTAAMQAAQTGEAPIFARIEHNAGHGAGKPTAMRIAEQRDIYAFLWHSFGLSIPDSL